MDSKEWTQEKINNMGVDSNFGYGNFFMVKTDKKEKLIEDLKKREVLVRDRGHLPQLNGYVRITISKKENMEKVLESLKKVCNVH
jgi:histidinol-phosphate/aromatic aminotransferase/cobyric acid decarboxylase-like protein